MTTLKLRYKGFLNTPTLWDNASVWELQQFAIEKQHQKIAIDIDNNLRLGKYVERLVSFQISALPNTTILAENLQIQDQRQTVGELDVLLKRDTQHIHLEVVYKFYVYDPSVGHSEIEHCIGPNRKDSLVEKLDKLKNKQLPLLHTNPCKSYLEPFNLTAKAFVQQVYFKAQLFLPYHQPNITLKTLNTNCVMGIYCNFKELLHFKTYKFYCPEKKDWLITPHTGVNWISYTTLRPLAQTYVEEQYAILLWAKSPTGILKKLMLVWW
jgi:hypothetical protein